MTIEIDGIEHVPIDGIEISEDHTDLKERLTRATEELDIKQAERDKIENERALTAHISTHYARDLRNPQAFVNLCMAKKLTADDDEQILRLFKSLPKVAKKSWINRFIK